MEVATAYAADKPHERGNVSFDDVIMIEINGIVRPMMISLMNES